MIVSYASLKKEIKLILVVDSNELKIIQVQVWDVIFSLHKKCTDQANCNLDRLKSNL